MPTSRPKRTVSRSKSKRVALPDWQTCRKAVTELREQTLIVAAKNEQCLSMAAGAGGTEDGESFYRLLVETRDAANRAREMARAFDDAVAGRTADRTH